MTVSVISKSAQMGVTTKYNVRDGFSPTIAVEDIPGGHRVTITDINGDHSYDCLDGIQGDPGQDGVSPEVSVTEIQDGHQITITDAEGEHTFNVLDGISPAVSVTDIAGGHRVTITDANGEHSYECMDGITPTASVSKAGKVATITITDANGTTTATITDGEDGIPVIDDTAGAGDTDKVWSADRMSSEISMLSSTKLDAAQKGAVNGVAELDENGHVLAAQLPSFVDDIVECDDFEHFPAIGETGKIYVDKTTNLEYRWGGSTYVALNPSLALGETSSTAYRGDRGAAAYAAAVTNPDSAPTLNSNNLVKSGGVYAELDSKAPKADPVFTGSISLGRKANTTVGTNSIATGTSVTASGNYSHAEGSNTTATHFASHAEGANTLASNSQAHAEGSNAIASGMNAHAEGQSTTAYGIASHAEGLSTTAQGSHSHTEGRATIARGEHSHAEGYGGTTYGTFGKADHTEGYQTIANSGSGENSFGAHAEGTLTSALASSAHAEGKETVASGDYSHAEGVGGVYTKNGVTYASGASSTAAHSEGFQTVASGYASHTEGYQTIASVYYAHAEGNNTCAHGQQSHAEGYSTFATASSAHAEGDYSSAQSQAAHAEGISTKATGQASHVEGIGNDNTAIEYEVYNTYDRTKEYNGRTFKSNGSPTMIPSAASNGSHAEGYKTLANGGGYQHTEGYMTYTSGANAEHAEGYRTTAMGGGGSHSEGKYTYAGGGGAAHAEGLYTAVSDGGAGHSEGMYTFVSGAGASHAEGYMTFATGRAAHAEGYNTQATADDSHAEGSETLAKAKHSNAAGVGTIAAGESSRVFGMYNVIDDAINMNYPLWISGTSYDVGDRVKRTFVNSGVTIAYIYECNTANSDTSFISSKWTQLYKFKYAEIVGNGTATDARSNARALDWAGNEYLSGDVYVGCNSDSTGGTKLAKLTDIPTISVQDVQVNGTSIINNGVANIPKAGTTLGAVKINSTYGITITSSGELDIINASASDIKAGENVNKPITPSQQHTSVFYALAKAAGDSTQSASGNAVGTYTAEAKTAIQNMFDVPAKSDIPTVPVQDVTIDGTSILSNGIANIPIAGASSPGVVKVEFGGLQLTGSGQLKISPAAESDCKAATANYSPIVPSKQYASTFYGLAKAAGDTTQSLSSNAIGNYTDNAKASIQTMLDVPSNDDMDDKAHVIMETATGSVATFTDGADGLPLEHCVVDIEPVQNLNGYDNPWPGGGNINLLPVMADISQTVSGVTATRNDDGSYTFSGTASVALSISFVDFTLPAGSYLFSNDGSNVTATGSGTKAIYIRDLDNLTNVVTLNIDSTNTGTAFTLETATNIRFYTVIGAGIAVSGKLYPMIRLSSVTTYTYSPYSNICPITGWTGASVVRTSKNLFGGTVLRDGVLNSMASAEDDPTDKYVKFVASATVSKPILTGKPFKENTQYTFVITFSKSSGVNANLMVVYTDGTNVKIPSKTQDPEVKETVVLVTNASKTVSYFTKTNQAGSTYLYYNESGIFEGVHTADDFVPYAGTTYPVSWQTETGTVYGGTLDVSTGVLTVDMASITVTESYNVGTATTGMKYASKSLSDITPATELLSNNNISSIYKFRINAPSDSGWFRVTNTTLFIYDSRFIDKETADGILALERPQIVYKIGNPITYQLTPAQINTLLGMNNIWADTGDTAVQYRADTELFVRKSIPSVPVQDVQVNNVSVLNQGVAIVPVANGSTYGVVKVGSGGTYGIEVNSNGIIQTNAAGSSTIKAGTASKPVITPNTQHQSVFYGLCKAAGDNTQSESANAVGQYTDAAKVAIQKMLGVYREWELINEVTTTEDLARVDITTDLNGQVFELSEIYARAELPQTTTGTQDYISCSILYNTENSTGNAPAPTLRYGSATGKLLPIYRAEIICGIVEAWGRQGSAWQSTQSMQGISSTLTTAKSIRGLRMSQYSASQTLVPSGTKITIYGKRI